MSDASDILKDPTKVLDMALHTSDARLGLVEVGRLHRHIQAGGALPAQWRGEGTAVDNAIRQMQGAARFASDQMEGDAYDALNSAICRLTGEPGPEDV